jgi:Mn-dependent DtxR family transcriptional regulator
MEARMPLSETAREILGFFRETHRKPGARMTMATLDAHFGTDPAVAVAISELKQLGYVIVPDAGTVELTDFGFDAIHRGVA